MSEEELAAAFYRHGGKEGLKYMNDTKKTAEFDLVRWATKEKYFVTMDTRDKFSGLFEGRVEGFYKALDLVLEEFEKETDPESLGAFAIPKVKQIIRKLKQEG